METHKDKYKRLTGREKKAIELCKNRKIDEYKLADILNVEYQQIGAFVLSNGLSRKIERS